MTTLEINTSDIFAINKLKEYAKEKFNFEINILETNDIVDKYYTGYKEDKQKLNKVYSEVKSGKIKLYTQEESKNMTNNILSKLKNKYGNN